MVIMQGEIGQLLVLFVVVVIALDAATHVKSAQVVFEDVSEAAGMNRESGSRPKYGGAAVADLDGDGHQDLLFGHHNEKSADVYFNHGDGSFKRAEFLLFGDIHGINPFRLSPSDVTMRFSVSRGGRHGTMPFAPRIFDVETNRAITEVTNASGVEPEAAGRGRTAIYMRLDEDTAYSDVLFLNAPMESHNLRHHRAFQNMAGTHFVFRDMTGPYPEDSNKFATVTDVDSDGVVELLAFQELRAYNLAAPFDLANITHGIFPRLDNRAVLGVAELDFDNDGWWDLYVVRTDVGDVGWVPISDPSDRLFRNVRGRYMDVSIEAGIPRGTQSQGVTTGDFNNDGWIDLLVVRYKKPDLLLLNNQDGTFTSQEAGFQTSTEAADTPGDMAVAVDLDRNGALDVVLSQGAWIRNDGVGYYRIMKNITPNLPNFLLVRVKSSPNAGATSLHALATVSIPAFSMRRRVGSPGTVVSVSYIELLHFGLGDQTIATEVSVRWMDGYVQTMENVNAGKTVTFGT